MNLFDISLLGTYRSHVVEKGAKRRESISFTSFCYCWLLGISIISWRSYIAWLFCIGETLSWYLPLTLYLPLIINPVEIMLIGLYPLKPVRRETKQSKEPTATPSNNSAATLTYIRPRDPKFLYLLISWQGNRKGATGTTTTALTVLPIMLKKGKKRGSWFHSVTLPLSLGFIIILQSSLGLCSWEILS